MGLLGILGCLDRLLEAPYVLTTGLGDVRSVSPGRDGGLLAATSTGVYAIAADGTAHLLDPSPASAVSADSRRAYVLREGRASWDGGESVTPGAVDLLAGYDTLLVLTPTTLHAVAPDAKSRLFSSGFTGARAVTLGASGGYLVVSEDTLWSVPGASDGGPSTATPLLTGLVDARAAAIDARERVYVVQGDPRGLWRVEDGRLTRMARWLDAANDLHFGVGGAFPAEQAYIATGTGTVDYVRPPP